MIPLFKPYMPNDILNNVEDILYSGKLTYGKYGRLFEEALREYLGNDYVMGVSTYNHAMLVALSVLEVGPGDEVLASPVSCLASNQPVITKGAKVVWVDVDPSSGTMDIDDLESKITTNTKAILHNHFCGYLGDVKAISEISEKYGIPVIDDCIEAFGSELSDNRAGNLKADISVFSFQAVRLPNTIDGGGLSFSNDKLYEKALLVRDYGIDRAIFRDSFNEINSNCDISVEGYGALMNDINAYIGYKQMTKLDELIRTQRGNAKVWDEFFMNHPDCSILKTTPESKPNYWVYGALSDNKSTLMAFFRERGVYASGVHINNNIYSVFGKQAELKGVNEFMRHYIAVPSGWWFNSEKIISNLE